MLAGLRAALEKLQKPPPPPPNNKKKTNQTPQKPHNLLWCCRGGVVCPVYHRQWQLFGKTQYCYLRIL
jgi:hypothetical protein